MQTIGVAVKAQHQVDNSNDILGIIQGSKELNHIKFKPSNSQDKNVQPIILPIIWGKHHKTQEYIYPNESMKKLLVLDAITIAHSHEKVAELGYRLICRKLGKIQNQRSRICSK